MLAERQPAMLRNKLLVCSAVLLLALGGATSLNAARQKLPAFVKVCHRSDPQLSQCLRNSLNSIKGRLNVGIPELFVPPLEPLVIPEMKLDQDSGAIYLNSKFTDITISGLSEFTLTDIHVDPSKLKFSMTMRIPQLHMDSLYSMKGKILMMPVVGSGQFKANFTNVELNTVISGQLHRKFDRQYLKVRDIKSKYDLGKAEVRLENLFNGDSELGERMNAFLNENFHSLSDEMRPLMERALSDIIRSSSEQLFAAYSYDDLLPE